jgi:hypothetical protein
MPDAPANAWTGHHLLTWLQAHPKLLDSPVHLLLMTKGEEDAYLTTAEEDRFEPGSPNVISLIADGPAAAIALPAPPSPAVDREALVEVLSRDHAEINALWDEDPDDYWRTLADRLIAAGYVCTPGHEWQRSACGATTRARMADRQDEEDTNATP